MKKVWILLQDDGFIRGVFDTEFKAKKSLIKMEEEGLLEYDHLTGVWFDENLRSTIIKEFDVK